MTIQINVSTTFLVRAFKNCILSQNKNSYVDYNGFGCFKVIKNTEQYERVEYKERLWSWFKKEYRYKYETWFQFSFYNSGLYINLNENFTFDQANELIDCLKSKIIQSEILKNADNIVEVGLIDKLIVENIIYEVCVIPDDIKYVLTTEMKFVYDV
jgi:hypothetical protein